MVRPTFDLQLIVVCPYRMEFCVCSCSRYVGFLFWPLHALTWQKWFSTTSWFISHDFMTDVGKAVNFIFTIALYPCIIDCMSNHSLSEIKRLGHPADDTSSFHSSRKDRKQSSFFILPSLRLEIAWRLVLNKSIKALECSNSLIVLSSWLPSLPVSTRCSRYT